MQRVAGGNGPPRPAPPLAGARAGSPALGSQPTGRKGGSRGCSDVGAGAQGVGLPQIPARLAHQGARMRACWVGAGGRVPGGRELGAEEGWRAAARSRPGSSHLPAAWAAWAASPPALCAARPGPCLSQYRRVLDQIRGRTYEEAIMMLEYMPYRACEPILKTLLSAGANAKNNMGLKKAKLVVAECFADEGPVMKRAQPRAQGRPFPILKPTCHVTIRLQES